MEVLVTLVERVDGAEVHCCDWRDLVPVVEAAGGCDALITDCPYSERTHAGHSDGIVNTTWGDTTVHGHPPAERRDLGYASWNADDVHAFVTAWHPLTRGWFVSITDHVLAPAWEAALKAAGRYVFSPLPYVVTGSRVRLAGDGPAQWGLWIVVARPSTREYATWGALPGAYVLPDGCTGSPCWRPGGSSAADREHKPVVGGKESWIACQLVEHYSRPGALVVDPCCGAGGIAVAALRSTNRRAIVGDVNRAHADLAALWVRHPWRVAPGVDRGRETGQMSLLGGMRG